MDGLEVLELVALFFLQKGTFGTKNSFKGSPDAIFTFLRFCFRKGQIVTLINSSSSISPRFQHKVVLLAVLTVFTVGFSSFCQ